MPDHPFTELFPHIYSRRLFLNPTIQQVAINLYTKYDNSSLNGCENFFDENFHHSKYEKKRNWKNTGMNKLEITGSQSNTIQLVLNPIQYNKLSLTCMGEEKSMMKHFTEKRDGRTAGRTEGRKEGRADRCEPVYPLPTLFQSGGIATKQQALTTNAD